MLTLTSGETISAVASSGDIVEYSIFGDETNGTINSFKKLAQGVIHDDTPTVIYTAPSGFETLVKSIHLVDASGVGAVGVQLSVDGHPITGFFAIESFGWGTYNSDGWKFYNNLGQILSAGAQGIQGIEGIQGIQGIAGPAGNVLQLEVQTVAQVGANLAINRGLGEVCELSLTANITAVTVINWPVHSPATLGRVILDITNTGAFTITGWPAAVKWGGGVPPVITATAGAKDRIMLSTTDGGTTIKGDIINQNYS